MKILKSLLICLFFVFSTVNAFASVEDQIHKSDIKHHFNFSDLTYSITFKAEKDYGKCQEGLRKFKVSYRIKNTIVWHDLFKETRNPFVYWSNQDSLGDIAELSRNYKKIPYRYVPIPFSSGVTTYYIKYDSVRIQRLPLSFFNQAIEIKVVARWGETNCSATHGEQTFTFDFDNSNSFATLKDLKTTKDEYCDKVMLKWKLDGALYDTLNVYDVYRRDTSTAAWVRLDSTYELYYNDTSAKPGAIYEYKVNTFTNYITSRRALGKDSVSGKRPIAGVPEISSISQANCNGDLEVNWSIPKGNAPEGFKLYRSDHRNFRDSTVWEIAGANIKYMDKTALSGKVYYYWVKSVVKAGSGCFIESDTSLAAVKHGNGVPPAPTIDSILTNDIRKSATIYWSDTSNLETSYKVRRSAASGVAEFTVSADSTTFTDKSAATCVNYTYDLLSINQQCAANGVISTNSDTASIAANIGGTFDSNHNKISASDGAFGDRIELKWKTNNRQNENWIIKRINPITNDTTQIAAPDGKTKYFIDNTANANTLYKYNIYGELDCAGNPLESNTSEDIGFRLAYGTVNGQITYSGGTAVKGVKVTATATSGASGTSAHFNGNNSLGTVAHDTAFASNNISIMAYVRTADSNKLQSIIEKHDGTNGFKFQLNKDSLAFTAGKVMKQVKIPDFKTKDWIAVAVTASQDSIVLFVKGKKVADFGNSATLFNNSSDISIGKLFEGEIDELRVFNRVLTAREIARSFDVYINPSMKSLIGYWRFDEDFGNTAYDYSKTILTSNKNHATLSHISWSNKKPSTTQLTAGAYTDSLGSYFIPFIPYLGSGDNYTIRPIFGTHKFTPATTTLLVGSGSANYTGQNFTDNSSFTVSGTVKYGDSASTYSCFVKGARLKVDGEVVVANGEVVTTNDTGTFEIQVPIGPHVVSVEQNKHVYAAGRFPASGAWNFQQNVQGIEFYDNTLVKVVGRVAGGGIQKSLLPALGKGKNNIGLAKVPFKSQQGNGCLTTMAVTDSLTGEYVINLPPMRYEVPNFHVESNAAIEFTNNSILDIASIPPVQTAKDTLFTKGTTYKRTPLGDNIKRIDTASYQKQRDYIYYVSPTVGVQGKKVAHILGADTLHFETAGVTVKIPSDSVPLKHAAFYENEKYSWEISAFEIYTNKDNPNQLKKDSVPMVEGSIVITNSLARTVGKVFDYGLSDSVAFNGVQEYVFNAGQANTTTDNLNPDNSFTKTCEITLRPINGNAVSWKVNNETFRGIVFGGRSLGNSFSTSGPDVVTMILRDPPGTGSSASWEKGTTVTSVYSYENIGGLAFDLNKNVALGTKFSVGLGYTTETEISNDLNYNTKIETTVNEKNELVRQETREVTISTGTGDQFVGAGADLFFGRAMNMDFGLTEMLTLIDTSNCGGNATCYGDTIYYNAKAYRLGIRNSMCVVPKGYETEFIYTQAGIENSVIPKLITLRNQLLQNNSDYQSYLSVSNVNYGKSNDDTVFANNATPNPETNIPKDDSLGVSYHFKGYRTIDTIYIDTIFTFPFTTVKRPVTVTLGVDSIWWYNKQIALWEDALARNERAKVMSTKAQRNISYQGGSTVSYSSSSTRSVSKTINIYFNLSENLTLKMGGKVGGSGVSIAQGTTMSFTHIDNSETSESKSTSFGYTIFDPDAIDEFSVDVFQPSDGFGPIFKTRGGQTSCPYQGETKTKYYQKGIVLDKATLQLDQPGITVSPANLYNVPAKDPGTITLNLINKGAEDNVYAMRVMENSNPYGAIIKIDGLGPNRDFAVPAKSSITKTLTIQKGPNHIEYDSIGLIFQSKCQYAYGTANYEDIADTAYISVNFLASCTDIDIQAPQNQFVANNSFDNKLPVVISGYDINYGGLEKIQLQYKPSNQASWIPIGREWFMDTANINTRYPNHPDPQIIPKNQSYITYTLEIDQLIDQDYDLRTLSTCKIPGNPDFDQKSKVVSGVFDRINPHPFGTPSPADGILDPNDDISIQFNEPIEAGSLTPDNFQLNGVLNGQELRHNKAVAFDGATTYLEIANGFDFTSENFTIEFWAKRNTLGGQQTIISQGATANNLFSISFVNSNKMEVNFGGKKYTSTFTILDDSTWHHYAVAYNKEQLELEITNSYQQTSETSTTNNFLASVQSGGKTYIGKNANNNSDFFNGSIHELRIWNKALPSAVVSSRSSQNLSGREAGLIGYWPMDEGKGYLAEDKARFRHAQVKANWEINPKSTAASFDGVSQYVVVDSAGTLAITPEMDLSIEFWFKTTGGVLQSFLSNGSGRFKQFDVNRNGWNIEMNAQNEIWIQNDSFAFKAVETNYADNKWHHFALVVNRLANTTAFIDGQQQKTISSKNFWGFGAAKLAIGARYSIDGTVGSFDQFFNGQIDEVRIWNTALLRDNIELNRYNRLAGNEFGLLAYYPFESYRLMMGVPALSPSLNNESTVLSNPKRINAKAVNGSVFTSESPAVALQRPVEEIKFSWSVNGDKIVITPNELPANIENVSLHIAVKGVKDLHGNVMQSPKTWLAYINKNQVLWQDREINLKKEINDTLTFTSKVVNSGGEVRNFTISNIPPWLTVSPSSGKVEPLKSKTIHFTVNPSINIGTYAEDLMLSTDFGFNEKLLINLKVIKTAPEFKVDPSLYQQSMSVIGQIRINGQVSTNPDDKLVAFINGEVRGITDLRYIPSYDKYLAFLDVYSNSADSIYFKVWNASEGQLHADVNPVLYFANNDLIGSPASPLYFDAINNLSYPIVLKRGWNWVSFPLKNSEENSFHNFFKSLNLQNGDIVKTIGNNANAQYGGSAIGWSGNLVNKGLSNDLSYLIKLSSNDTLDYKGLSIDPDTVLIKVSEGWNRIGFISLKNMETKTALANFNAQNGDLIKSQEQFAYFDENLGWIGSLNTLEPTKGYLLKSAADTSFVYPRQGLFRMKKEQSANKLADMLTAGFALNPHDFEAGVAAIVKVEGCKEMVQNNHIILAAFKGDELRGWSETATQLNEEIGYQYYLTVYGETEDQFSFALIDTSNSDLIELSGILNYEKNGLVGTAKKPLIIHSIGKVDCDAYKTELNSNPEFTSSLVYPNPFRNTLNVMVPSDLGEEVELSLLDSYGRVIHREIAIKGSVLNWNEIAGGKNVAKGVYYIQFNTEEGSKIEKVVKY